MIKKILDVIFIIFLAAASIITVHISNKQNVEHKSLKASIYKQQEIIDIASELEIIKKSGSWYAYNDVKIGQGGDQVKQMFNDNPEMQEEIHQKILTALNQQ